MPTVLPQLATSAVSWAKILALVIGSGGLSALATTFLGHWLSSRKEFTSDKEEAVSAALELAVRFETYAVDALERTIFPDEDIDDDVLDGHAPELPKFPDIFTVNWKALEPELAARSLTFVVELRLANNLIRAPLGYALDRDSVVKEFGKQVNRTGRLAAALARDLRARYGLPAFDLAAAWSASAHYDFQT